VNTRNPFYPNGAQKTMGISLDRERQSWCNIRYEISARSALECGSHAAAFITVVLTEVDY
jgi:hypothetical protein